MSSTSCFSRVCFTSKFADFSSTKLNEVKSPVIIERFDDSNSCSIEDILEFTAFKSGVGLFEEDENAGGLLNGLLGDEDFSIELFRLFSPEGGPGDVAPATAFFKLADKKSNDLLFGEEVLRVLDNVVIEPLGESASPESSASNSNEPLGRDAFIKDSKTGESVISGGGV